MLHLSSKTVYLLKKEMPELFNKVTSGSIILLMDALYHAINEMLVQEIIGKGLNVYVLDEDVKRRGIQNMLIKGVKIITYDEFIDLVMDPDTRTLNL